MFEKYSASDGKISKESLKEAFTDLNVYTSDAEGFDELFIEFDLDSDGQIDFDEFKSAVLRPTPLETWSKQIPWWQIISDAIPRTHSSDPLRDVANLTATQIDAICTELGKSIKHVLCEQSRKLKQAFDAMDKAPSTGPTQTKFASTFKASAGDCEDFHRGLSGRVGTRLCLHCPCPH